jgi:CubicO group peptidase (beta-lactamase class C family)
MASFQLRRRDLLAMGASAFVVPRLLRAGPDSNAVDSAFDTFVARYMKAMNAPGMTVALARRDGSIRAAVFGYSDLESRAPVTPDHLFQIGSITKSFVALTCLQLHDEGKLDLDRPVLDYLPWLPIVCKFGTITPHHLLTHTSGLPNSLALQLSDPGARYVQGYRPGEHFHYCNLGFGILGRLISAIDQRPWSESVRRRILEPLGMKSTSAVIGGDTQPRMARSYLPKYGDRLHTRMCELAPTDLLVFDNSAGSVTSTPADMALYMQMLMKNGAGVISKDSWAKFTNPYIEAPELGPTSKYGYGIGVDHLDGRLILRHTGGMASFMSSITVDLDSGVAAFASINAMLGYRPVPVTEFAARLMFAEKQSKSAPAAPEINDPRQVKNAADYVGTFETSSGRKIQIAAEGSALSLITGDKRIPLEHQGADAFLADDYSWLRFPLMFGRANGKVAELAHGADWYVNEKYSGPKSFTTPADYESFAGHYHSDSPWFRSDRIVIRKGQLWMNGATPLEPIGGALFRPGRETFSPDVVEFLEVANGKALLMKTNGADQWRVDIA